MYGLPAFSFFFLTTILDFPDTRASQTTCPPLELQEVAFRSYVLRPHIFFASPFFFGVESFSIVLPAPFPGGTTSCFSLFFFFQISFFFPG